MTEQIFSSYLDWGYNIPWLCVWFVLGGHSCIALQTLIHLFHQQGQRTSLMCQLQLAREFFDEMFHLCVEVWTLYPRSKKCNNKTIFFCIHGIKKGPSMSPPSGECINSNWNNGLISRLPSLTWNEYIFQKNILIITVQRTYHFLKEKTQKCI